jgi:glycosyltransferase involved in cell wall biosynthesis
VNISVCVPATRPDSAVYTVKSVLNQKYDDWELIVVCQGKRPEFEAMVANASNGDNRVRCIHLQQNGLSLARNAGVTNSDGEVVAFIDDDCTAREDWLSCIADRMNRFEHVGFVAGSVISPDFGPPLSTCPSCIPGEATYNPTDEFGKPPKEFGCIGANFAIRRGILDRVGPFDTYLGAGTEYAAGEDVDFVFRLEQAGVIMQSTPESVVYHTYGTRYGLSALLRQSRNYARGNGCLAGKLTLSGDARGQLMLRGTLRGIFEDLRSVKNWWRLPISIRRVFYYRQAYLQCLEQFIVVSPGVLQMRKYENDYEDAVRATAAVS